jgi:hypothetical protein
MLKAVFRWRFSILSFLPSSRQMRNSGVIDFLIGTAGCCFSTGATCGRPMPDSVR